VCVYVFYPNVCDKACAVINLTSVCRDMTT